MGGRRGEKEDKGGAKVYEACDEKKKTLSFTSPEKDFFYLFMKSLIHRERENGQLVTT
jgi:hypothetical protein